MFLNSRTPETAAIINAKDCHFCGALGPSYYATAKQAEDFIARRANIQTIMPELSADDRERFISGTCPSCWASIFPPRCSVRVVTGRIFKEFSQHRVSKLYRRSVFIHHYILRRGVL